MKKIYFLIFTIIIYSCIEKKSNLTVKVNVKGLKKGTVYLKKKIDTSLITIDSVIVNNDSPFNLYGNIESPEMLYLLLDKNSNNNQEVSFFADKGITEISTTLKDFPFKTKIKGSKQQKTLEEYFSTISKFNNNNLELIKDSFEARKKGDTSKFNDIEKKQNNFLKRKYLYAVNFALNNKDSEVAPYIAVNELYNVKIKFLDTINNSLTTEIKNSKYGKELASFIKKRKESSK